MNTTRLPLARVWWQAHVVDDRITLFREPHVADFLRCNVWHINGRDCDLVVDTGLGLAPLLPQLHLSQHSQVMVVLTHTHGDHSGGWYEFDERCLHWLEAGNVDPSTATADLHSLCARDLDIVERYHMVDVGYDIPDCFVTALPSGVNDLSLPFRPAAATRNLDSGDVIDLGDRAFEVLHLPGHSPGSIGLLDRDSRLLLSGDAIYDGPLLDELAGSCIADYRETMTRLLNLSVDLVLPGHGEPFGADRLHEIAASYLRRRRVGPETTEVRPS